MSLAYTRYRYCDVAVADRLGEKIECRDLSYRLLLQPPYDLLSLDHVRERLHDVHKHDYVVARSRQERKLLGCFRVESPYPVVEKHVNLLPSFRRACDSAHRIIDVGAYIDGTHGPKMRVFEGLFAVLIRFMLARGMSMIYIQTRPRQQRDYGQLGFRTGSDLFEVDGWLGTWVAMYLDVRTLVARWDDEKLALDHQRAEGVALSRTFWKRAMDRIASPEGWAIGPRGITRSDQPPEPRVQNDGTTA